MMTKRGPGGVGKLGRLGQSDLVSMLAAAIKRHEGWYPPGTSGYPNGSVSYRNNNPGNLRPLRNGNWTGQVGVDSGGYVIFESVASGEVALERQIQTNITRGLTLEEFFAGKPGVYGGYAPAADRNQPNVYAANVAEWTGIPLNVPLFSLGSAAALEVPAADLTTDIEPAPEGGDESGTADLEMIALGLIAAAFVWWATGK